MTFASAQWIHLALSTGQITSPTQISMPFSFCCALPLPTTNTIVVAAIVGTCPSFIPQELHSLIQGHHAAHFLTPIPNNVSLHYVVPPNGYNAAPYHFAYVDHGAGTATIVATTPAPLAYHPLHGSQFSAHYHIQTLFPQAYINPGFMTVGTVLQLTQQGECQASKGGA